MSNPKFSCIIPGCTKTTAAHHIIKHILSHSQSEIKAKLNTSLGPGTRGSLIRINTKVEGVANNFQACLGCNKIFKKIPLQVAHQQDCPNKEKHKEMCKSFITSEPEAAPVPVEPSEDVSKLKKRITALESNLKSAEKIVDESEDISQAFIELLQRLQENHKDIFIEQMGMVRYGRPEVYRKVCEDLDIEEGGVRGVFDPPPIEESEW